MNTSTSRPLNCDILLRGGHVIDPSQALHGVHDVAVNKGRIIAIEKALGDVEAVNTVDAGGLIVTPGLIDLHVHVYPGHTDLGVEPDPLCPAGGVTTLLDTGSSGADNFRGFRRDVIDRADTRILALLNLSRIGLVASSSVGELLDRRYADPDGVVRTIQENRDVAIGVKIRASEHIIGAGEQGWENFRDAVSAARRSGTWLMVHIGDSPMSIPDMLEFLEPGDCITHCFRGGSERLLDGHDRLFPAVREAAERGVVFDVGHGAGSFQWEVIEAALEQGFEPTTISTDLHAGNIHGPVYDLPTTMSKLRFLGVTLERVIEMTTANPARVIGRGGDLGTLRVGALADITLLERRTGRFVFADSYGGERVGTELLVAATTIRGGTIVKP